MAANISDDEMRTHLMRIYGNNIPPILDSTRTTLMRRISQSNVNASDGSTHDDAILPEAISLNDVRSSPNPVKTNAFKTLVFFDLEATGLNSQTSPPRITELCMKALDVQHFKTFDKFFKNELDSQSIESFTPRVTNSLNLCFNPRSMIPQKVSDMTGLTNTLLENQHGFSTLTATLLNSFIGHLPQPVCLVAHNGNRYDFPLLKSELQKANSDLDPSLTTIDSLEALRFIFKNMDMIIESEEIEELVINGALDEEMEVDSKAAEVQKPCLRDEDELNVYKTPEKSASMRPKYPPPTNHTLNRRQASELLSNERRRNGAKIKRKLNFNTPSSFSLPKLFEHIFGQEPNNSHGAEVDVLNLMRVCATKSRAFYEYTEKNAVPFQNIVRMW